MSWYKKAKLADKAISDDQYIFSVCQYCKRWATNDGGYGKNPNQSYWKKDNELNREEKQEAKKAISDMRFGDLNNKTGISHTVCGYCMNLVDKMGYPETRKKIDILTEKSLALT